MKVTKLIRVAQVAGAIAGLSILCWAAYSVIFYLATAPRFEVKKLSVSGFKRVEENQILAKAGSDRPVMDQISATGCDAQILSPAQTIERVQNDYVKWGRVVKEANIRAE